MPNFFTKSMAVLAGTALFEMLLSGRAAAQVSMSAAEAALGRPELWLLLAFVLLVVGAYYWWQSRLEEEYEAAPEVADSRSTAPNRGASHSAEAQAASRMTRVSPELLAYLTRERDREPAVDIDQAFFTPEGSRAVMGPAAQPGPAGESRVRLASGVAWHSQEADWPGAARLLPPAAKPRSASAVAETLRSAAPGGASLRRPGESEGRLGRGEVRARSAAAAAGGRSLAPSASPFALIFPESSRKVQLRRGVVTIGSAPDNHIVLDELEVVPNHLEIQVQDSECAVKLRDADGAVIINGRPLAAGRVTLKPGDELRIGRTLAVLRKSESAVGRPREYHRMLQEA